MEENKKLVIIKSIIKHIKIPQLLVFIVLFTVNTYAWFIYSQKITNNVAVHVRGWKVMFTSKDRVVSNLININVDNLYPGMDDFSESIDIYNESEVASHVYYTIIEANIMGETYVTTEGRVKRGEQELEDDMTSDDFEEYLATNYPFVIEMGVSKDSMSTTDEQAIFTLNVTWEYEHSNDAEDTYWGERAYEYMRDNSTSSCISLKVDLSVEQVNSNIDDSYEE